MDRRIVCKRREIDHIFRNVKVGNCVDIAGVFTNFESIGSIAASKEIVAFAAIYDIITRRA